MTESEIRLPTLNTASFIDFLVVLTLNRESESEIKEV